MKMKSRLYKSYTPQLAAIIDRESGVKRLSHIHLILDEEVRGLLYPNDLTKYGTRKSTGRSRAIADHSVGLKLNALLSL